MLTTAFRISGVVGPFERHPAGQRFVEDGAEREEIRSVIDDASQRLFRRHVGQRAEHDVLVAHPLRSPLRRRRARADALGQAEVEYFHGALRRDHDVGALQIAVDDAAFARFLERPGHLHRDPDNSVHGEWPAAEHGRECATLDRFHRDVGPAVGLANLEDRTDVRMVQRRGRRSFAAEECTAVGIVGHVGAEHFQRHRSPQLRIVGEIDLTHPAASERAHDSEAADGGEGYGLG
jgi:hypothetical protein